MKKIELSPYRIYWAEFTPIRGGVVTKHDLRKIGLPFAVDYNTGQKNYFRHFASKESAVKFVTTFNERLDKIYAVRLFTDKQFGMRKREDNYAVPYTKKQLAEVYYVG